ncbi:MAG TPA: ferritin-like protein [Acidimicrobiales bacterium]|nr:ferritin-like protein [Acidimicrobiales bacterium]
MICAAAELEHALMCEYLFAAFSLKETTDEGLTQEQLAAVNRWRSVILGVAGQEMLHLALTANMLTALGASPHLSRPNLPQPARHYPAGVKLVFLPFGEQALRHFLYLERPEGMALDDAEGIGALGEAVPVTAADDIVPHLQEFSTVGHLYRSIEEGFRHLAGKLGTDRLFVGPAQAQVTSAEFRWPQLIAVTDVESATAAIEEIVEQGEGPRGDWRQAHFGRFKGVLDEFLAMKAADPAFEPARPVIAAGVRPGEGDGARPIITDPLTAKVADLSNVIYEVLLLLLYRLLSRIDETDEEAATLAKVAVGLMYQGVAPVGKVLGTLPVGPELPGATAGPPFELFYQPDYLLPHREAAWLLISERLAEAAAFADRLAETVVGLKPVGAALSRHAETIGSRAKRTA